MSDDDAIEDVAVNVIVVPEFSARDEAEAAKVTVGADSFSVIVKIGRAHV
jgi:hypothetical protein